MPSGLTLPFRFVPDTFADADQVNANNDAIVAKFAGGIFDGDCSPQMDLDGNKLSSNPLKQVPESRLGNNAVSARVLASSTSTDSLRAVSADHMKDLSVPSRAYQGYSLLAGKVKASLLRNTFGTGSMGTQASTTVAMTANPGNLPLLSNPAGIVPLAAWLSVSNAGIPSTIGLTLTVYADVNGVPYWVLHNPTAGSVILTPYTGNFLYIPTS